MKAMTKNENGNSYIDRLLNYEAVGSLCSTVMMASYPVLLST